MNGCTHFQGASIHLSYKVHAYICLQSHLGYKIGLILVSYDGSYIYGLMFSLILYWTLCVFVLFWILYSKHNKLEVFCGFCAVVMLNSQQAKQLPSTEIQRNDKPPTWLHRELSRHCQRPQLRGDIHVASIDDIYILNEHMITCFV